MERLVNLINTTELNTVVLDVKEDGKVNYASEVESVKKIGAYHELYNVDEVIKLLHDNNIYVIGRIVCFRDNYLAGKRVDLAIKRKDGCGQTHAEKMKLITGKILSLRLMQYRAFLKKRQVK